MKQKQVKVFLSVLAVMLMAWTFSSCSKSSSTPSTNFTTLNTEITTAQALLAATKEGTIPGDYLPGSKATLTAAITAAQAVVASTTTTQVEETAAAAQLTAAVAAYNAAINVAITGLVGQWTFDELTTASAGTAVVDYSGNNHNGTLQAGDAFWSTPAGYSAVGLYAAYPVPATNVPTITADRYGNQHALHFSVGANVDIPYSTALNPASITITLWAKADTLPGQTGTYQYFDNNYMLALNRWNGYKFQFQHTPRAFFTVNNGNAKAGTGGYDNQDNNVTINGITKNWIHYAVTFTSGTMTFYVNGFNTGTWATLAETGTIALLNGAAGTTTFPVDLVFGQDLPTASYSSDSNSPLYRNYGGFYIGALDDVRIYNTALTQAQITSIYNLEKP